jgi:eukaryotic-like serine/threonine-protein kinase
MTPEGKAARATAGQRFASFELIAPLGAGAMGEVWRALDHELRRHVAIKILPALYSQDPDRLRRFEQEARAAGMLNHPNVLTVYTIGRHNETPYVVTELLDGVTLRQRLANGAIAESKAIDYGDQLVQGLAAAHDKGIVHRDLKPENVFITRDDRVKILDFGLAKLAASGSLDERETQTAAGLALGTPAYMSPEQVRGEPADHRSDIFAVGVLLYEMLTGRRPFVGDTTVETMAAILKHDPSPILERTSQVEQVVRHCLEKEPAARYQSARDLAFQLRLVRHAPSSIHAPLPTGTRRRTVVTAVAGLTLLAAITLTWWLMRSAAPSYALNFRRVTSDSGLTTDPALSPDGRLIVYASDRAGADNLDIWRQQLATGEAIPLTSDPADESEPDFSPDGNRVAFRSEREGGGIYVVSAFGGEPRLVARQGRRPRFSPDGASIAYWIQGAPFYTGRVFITPAAGGVPLPVRPEFASARYPIWSPDGRKLLVLGAPDPKDVGPGGDWWIVPLDGDPPINTGAVDIVKRQGLRIGPTLTPVPAAWVGDEVFFSGGSDENANVWRIAISASTGKAEHAAVRLTSGTSIEVKPSAISAGAIAFASVTEHLNIWSVFLDATRGTVRGDAGQVTRAAFDAHNSISADGKKLVFISTRSGNPDVWMKDLASGKETAVIATPAHEEQPEITADGTRVCYLVVEGSPGSPRFYIDQVATAGGVPERLCEGCGRPWDWSPDGSKLLYLIPEGRKQPGLSIGLIDVAQHQKRDYLEHPAYGLGRARFSPDGRWISFLAFNSAGLNRVVIAPFRSETPPREDEWIIIAEESRMPLEKPRWSPDGNLLYYTSDADGFRCILARRLDPATKRPIGPPIDVYHSHSPRRSLMNAAFGPQEITLSPDRLFFNMGEKTGNIWIAERKP